MKIEPAHGPWSYDIASEELRDVRGNVIGHVEPASGVIAAAGCELFSLCVNLVKLYDAGFRATKAEANADVLDAVRLALQAGVSNLYDALQRLDDEWTKIEEKSNGAAGGKPAEDAKDPRSATFANRSEGADFGPDPTSSPVQGLQEALATALRERDEAREEARAAQAAWAKAKFRALPEHVQDTLDNVIARADTAEELVNKSELRRDAAESERDTLRAEVKRLRGAVSDLSEALLGRRDALKEPYQHRERLAYETAAGMARAALASGVGRG